MRKRTPIPDTSAQPESIRGAAKRLDCSPAYMFQLKREGRLSWDEHGLVVIEPASTKQPLLDQQLLMLKEKARKECLEYTKEMAELMKADAALVGGDLMAQTLTQACRPLPVALAKAAKGQERRVIEDTLHGVVAGFFDRLRAGMKPMGRPALTVRTPRSGLTTWQSDDSLTELQKLQSALKDQKLKRVKMQSAVMTGQLVKTDLVVRRFHDALASFREEIITMPHRLAPRLEGLPMTALMSAITGDVEQVLGRVHKAMGQLTCSEKEIIDEDAA